MILGVLLALGDSFEDMAKTGQDIRFVEYYLKSYSQAFEEVYVFSYGQVIPRSLPKNVFVFTNAKNRHRYLFALLLPFIFIKRYRECQSFRVFHLSGTVAAIIGKIFFNKPFTFNYAYDYQKDAVLGGKYFQALFYLLLKPLALYFAVKVLVANKLLFSLLRLKKGYYLPNGVDTNKFRPYIKQNKNRIPIILSIGRLETQKNYLELISSLSGLNCKMILIGEGSLKEKIKSLAKKLKIDLKIVPPKSNNKLPAIYNSCDIFILPSLTEGHPKVLIEAMACGKAVIGSRVGGIPDLIKNGKTGLLCGTKEDSIKSTVKHLLEETQLRENLGSNAREFVLKNFDLKKILKKEVDVLKSTE